MKPLDLKIDWLRSLGLGVQQKGEAVYISAQPVPGERWRVLVLFGNPTYRRLREGLRTHFRAWGIR